MPHHAMDHKMMHSTEMANFSDTRISLNLPPMMKQHQLSNMRGHLDAIRNIIGSLSEEDFAAASNIASQQLGSTKKMMAMCNSFDNEEFKTMGLAFHKSADRLAETLKEGNIKTSLRALKTTMNSCVSCHATFRQ
ncbi:MAG: cytochrome C [Piscirickettsiaceae bacterium]|nr:MAG: cytochrome C [Piscirickettsiaceae bacterium]PCI67832.1 MAG: cytochrome C [Piscirickettsiaceae bacterium]